jgi:hypothetical protein
MERVSAHTVSATIFCLHSSVMKSRVHFFPAAGVTTGPYSISCTFTLFGKGVEKKSVTVDGGRLGQPDGIRLEDAFPVLRSDASGIFGLTLELSCQQQRVNMLPSQAAIELVSPQSTVLYGLPRFSPTPGTSEEGVEAENTVDAMAPQQAAVFLDSFTTTSLVVINPNKRVLKPNVYRLVNGVRTPLHVGTVAGESAVEIPLEEIILKESAPFECSWGLMRSELIYLGEPSFSDVSVATTVTPAGTIPALAPSVVAPGISVEEVQPTYALLYREPVSKRPTSASAL